jgi:manganese transport protein
VYSKIVLIFALPVPMIVLVVLTSRREVMGQFVNSRKLTTIAVGATVVILALNVGLVLQTLGVAVPASPAA